MAVTRRWEGGRDGERQSIFLDSWGTARKERALEAIAKGGNQLKARKAWTQTQNLALKGQENISFQKGGKDDWRYGEVQSQREGKIMFLTHGFQFLSEIRGETVCQEWEQWEWSRGLEESGE